MSKKMKKNIDYENLKKFKENLDKEISDLSAKQDIITKPPITDNSVDWNTLTETAIYPVGIQNGEGLSDSSTHGLSSAYPYGFLIVTARLNYNGWLYQLYINDRSEVYIRSLYTSWRSWVRIDGRVTGIKGNLETEYRTGEVNIRPEDIFLSKSKISETTDWNTATAFGVYTVSSSSALSGTKNAPAGAYGHGFLFVMSNPQITQDIYQIYVNGDRKWFQRERYSGSWKEWTQINGNL